MAEQRPTLVGVQYLRGIAALLVVLHHALEESLGAAAPYAPDWLVTSGAAGVDVFFVISGFIMLYVSFPDGARPLRPSQFLIRRVLRIYPFYWACLLVVVALTTVGLFRSLHLAPDMLVRSALLLPTRTHVIGVSWTLVYEMYFYLVFAATLFLQSRALSVLLTTTTIVALYGVGRFAPDPAFASFFANAIPLEFCFGLGLAYVFSAAKPIFSQYKILLIAPAVVAIAAAPLFIPHPTAGLPSPIRALAWGVPAVMLVAGFLTIRWWGLTGRIASLLGDASYAVYLTHPFVMVVYARLVKDGGAIGQVPWPVSATALVLVSTAVGVAAHLLVEKRLVVWAQALTRPQAKAVRAAI